ncbi:MAG: serine hydrolase, partial [Bdellovibrionales bacterium]|nr:serine hydrolase [Bdellovibrionales bacterium]
MKLKILPVVALFCLFGCQTSAPSDSDGYTKRRRGGHIQKATTKPREFKDELGHLLVDQMKTEQREGLGLFLFRIEDNRLLFASTFGVAETIRGRGSFSGTDPMSAGSSSLWISSAIMLRLVAKKQIGLDWTTGRVLGWKGDPGKITLRDLLSLTSGLPGRPQGFNCFSRVDRTLQDCATELYGKLLSKEIPLARGGSQLSYGPSHIQIAAAMAERVTSQRWVDLVKTEFVRPLKLSSETNYFTLPAKREGQSNPSAFEGLVISMRDYAIFLRMLVDNGKKYLPEKIVDAMLTDQFALYTKIESSPMKTLLKKDYHMGFGNWVECEPGGDEGCKELNINSCPGVYGWYPFIDEGRGLYGVLAALEGHTASRSAEPALRSWRILGKIREFTENWRF